MVRVFDLNVTDSESIVETPAILKEGEELTVRVNADGRTTRCGNHELDPVGEARRA